ncbi:MAG: glycosyl hydrolase [Bacteroidetes bacterium]|nr:glycosyl hydrolase [Bacteroidota bacterium]
MKNSLLLGTRKGLIVCRKKHGNWKITDLHFEGVPVSIAYADERNGTWWACLDHGHWGVKLHRSNDEGKTWAEVTAPAYPEGAEIKPGEAATTRYLWSVQHGGVKNPDRVWIGTEPGGLFRSDDGGKNFQLMEALWNHPSREKNWFGAGRDTPGIHSIVVDSRNEDRVLVGVSVAGVFETTDAGKTWAVRNKGMTADYLPDPNSEVGQDPHILVAAPSNPDVIWQQNHCGIFRSVDSGHNWQNISDENGIAKFGFGIAVAHDNPDQAWVAPGTSDEKRVAFKNALCICRTDDGGKSWQAYRKGLPQENCFDIVYRHALAAAGDDVVFGTTTGNVFTSGDRGKSWDLLSNYLPMVYSVQLI